jgi:cell division protein FtsZ
MMGTGEASGEGRALAAAEAAIANPLLDETSMKGAQGLLISITGGRDLTLFELDEAATRIREEVDPDANIILGATFDEELEGLIRVSVVATGIDRTAAEVAGRSADFRPVAAKPVVRPSAAIPAQQPVAQHQPAPVHQPVMQQPVAQPVQQPVQPQASADQIAAAIREAEMERELDIATRAAQAQVQAPVQPAHEENFRPQSKLFAGAAPVEAAPVMRQPQPQMQPVQAQPQPQPQPVMRQEPVAPVMRQQPEQVRMPKVEDFPPVVKAEMDRRAQPAAAPIAEERGPMGLLNRITSSLGLREREQAPAAADMTASAPTAASQQRRPLSPEASLYAPRRGQLDDHGRASPQAARPQEDDQLEIPAFLRRQSN